jgi:hypothetical protein
MGGDFGDRFPLFGDVFPYSPTTLFWYQKLAPYAVKAAAAEPGNTEAFIAEVRKCPAGEAKPPPYSGPAVASWRSLNCWVGVYYGLFGNPLTGPFYYGNDMKPISATRIKKPADAMMYMDCVTHYVYSPLVWPFDKDVNGDGMMDSSSGVSAGEFAFNDARPTVYNRGANVALLDSHAERVPFKKLWEWRNNKIVNSFWYLED